MKYRVCISCSEQEADFLQKKIRSQNKACFLQRTAFSEYELVLMPEKEISQVEIDKICDMRYDC